MNSTQLTALITDLVSQPTESEWVEFKANHQTPEDIGKRISALANSACLIGEPYGYLVFGVQDGNHDIIGTTYNPHQKAKGNEDLEPWLMRKLTPRLDMRIYEHHQDNKRLVIFRIPAAHNVPIEFDKIAYVRVGSNTHSLKDYPDKERTIWLRQLDWSATICQTATLADLCPEAISKARQLYTVKNPRLADQISTWDDITFLNKAKITINGQITNTALILLGLPESDHYLSPSVAKITWILKGVDNVEKDYQHFEPPFVLAIEQVYNKIRNLKYRYIVDGTLFPDEIDQYEPYIIREALNNAIAHQDYRLAGRIIVVEREDSTLTFKNSGDFIPQTIQNVLQKNAPAQRYRNPFLVAAMVNLNLIDTIGSGIRRMFDIQRKRYFPLPDYDFSDHSITATFTGKVLNMDYARKLAQMPDLSLDEIVLMDKLQKQHEIDEDDAVILRKKGLIEGRKPNYHLSSAVAVKTDQKKEYVEMRGLEDSYYESLVIAYLKKFGHAKRLDIDKLLLDKLSSVLDETQKKNKVRNMLQRMRNQRLIDIEGKTWRLISDN